MQEIDHLDDFENWLDSASDDALAIAIQDLDLRSKSAEIMARRWPGSLFLGCIIESDAAGHIVVSGGIVIPDLEDFHFAAHRAHLYSASEIFAGFDPNDPDAFHRTWDYRVYRQYLEHGKDQPSSIRVSLARRLHDHSMTDAVVELLQGQRVVAVMGGHGMERSDPFYARVARISRRLTREGFLMITGGGPGAMEAAHLGAWFTTRVDDELDRALEILTPRPAGAPVGKEYADRDWLHRGMRVIEHFPLDTEGRQRSTSLGIPTWLYGHEPPAPFATHIAKYFANSVREDGLLALALNGVVFAPGSAGTTQEIFQDATQNHYGTVGYYSPMILFGKEHWTTKRPVWPLIEHVARGQRFGELLVLTDDEDEIVERLLSFRREDYRVS